MMLAQKAETKESSSATLKMSYEAFLAWADEDVRAEWVNGEVVVHMPTKPIHQSTVKFLLFLLELFVELFDLGIVHIAPLEMRLQHSSREPDLLFLAKENLQRLTENRLLGPADLVIEIISTESVHRDRRDKFKEYRDEGVREYWIIDPRPGKQRADFFYLDEERDYVLFATEDDEWMASKVLSGFGLRPNWLWQVDELNPLTCALEIGGVTEALQAQILQAKSSSAADG
ncbi:MAG: Uma2 family endonuclease [Chloroflexota bacterium]